jgi:PBSX family phage terminase large subunit
MTLPQRIEDKETALAVLEAIEQYNLKPLTFTDPKFPEQTAFVVDDGPRVGALCTRRAGKSYGAGLKIYRSAHKVPGCTVLYMGLTRKTAKKIMWKDVMKVIDRDLELGCKFNEAELSIKCPNGSIIYLEGADAGKDEMDKVLGGKLMLALIDEGGSYRIDLRKLCYEIIEPALADYDGTLAMIGTPTDLLDSLFHHVTDGREHGWSTHSWNTTDNPYMAEVWEKRLKMLKETNPLIEETPSYRRMYLGEWVTDISALCYKYDIHRNTVEALPHRADRDYIYMMGVDLGFNDPSAFVISAFSKVDKNLYFVEAYKRSEMIISDVAERIKYYNKKYDIYRVVIDNASKQAVEELKQRYGLGLVAADKAGKSEFIEIMNSEMIQGRIKVLDVPETEPLRTEWGSLIWDDRSDRREEHPACENHCADGALYNWRECYQYLSEVPDNRVQTEAEKIDEWEEEQAELLEENNQKPFWERDWG